MSARTTIDAVSRGLLEKRWITGLIALFLLAAALVLAWQWERQQNAEQFRQASVQAAILAGSVSGALAFDDAITAGEYVDALRLDRQVQAAGVYGAEGDLVAGFGRNGERVPARVAAQDPYVEDGRLTVVVPVRQGNLALGHVYLRTSVEPFAARLSRYVAIGLILMLAALLIAILGAANAAAAAANRELQTQILAREQAETALAQAQKMEALGQLTGGVAHDFNNLLMAASSGLELMDRAKDDTRRERLKAGIRDALDRGARITEQLLAFSRRRPMQAEVVQIDEHVAKLAELLDHSLRENVTVRFEIAKGLWPVEVDLSQFDVAILNLAVNAKDAMPKGGLLTIRAQNRPGALDGRDSVEFSAEDEGVGMTPDALEKAFEPFFTTKDIGRGTGLGLSQVYGFVQAAGGRVSIDSTPFEGTKVTLLLPRCTPRGPPKARGSAAGEGGKLDGLCVLLVEDDASLNELVSEMLEEHGSHVVRALSAAEGLTKFDAHAIEAVLSDMVMPGEMDGLDLARRLRERSSDVPVVLMTGYSAAAGAAQTEGFPVLRKPFTLATLAECLEHVLERELDDHSSGSANT
jgi:signal transduction histidine kinase/CheY-like chemotaxis protein